jgi:hypothetical protein
MKPRPRRIDGKQTPIVKRPNITDVCSALGVHPWMPIIGTMRTEEWVVG